MNFSEYYFEFFKYTFETILACFCFVGGIEKHSRFFLRCFSMLSVTALMTALLSALAPHLGLGDYGTGMAVIYGLLSIMPFFFLFFCFRDSIWNLLFCYISGPVIRMCVKKIFDILLVILPFFDSNLTLFAKGQPLRYVLYYLILFVSYLIVYFSFRNILRKGYLLTLDGRLFSIYIAILCINFILNNLEPILLEINVHYYALLAFCEIAYYILILCMQSFLFQMAQAKLEAHDLQELWKKDKQQYELMKENIEIINIMCHDLRHQVRTMGKQEQLSPQFVQELEHSISVYDSKFQTGNQTLDVILTDKHLRCDAEKIQFTCIVDGEKLNFIEHSDLISLLGNALENALEYEMTVPDTENRFINLLICQKAGFVIINMENYFEGDLKIKDGYPVTHKQDKAFHGYGLKSMRRIAKKYDGTMDFSTEGNTFFLNLVFPLSDVALHAGGG